VLLCVVYRPMKNYLISIPYKGPGVGDNLLLNIMKFYVNISRLKST